MVDLIEGLLTVDTSGDLKKFAQSLDSLREFTDANPSLALLLYVDLDAELEECFKSSLFPRTAKPGSQPICQVAGANLWEIKEKIEAAWNGSKEQAVTQRVHQLAFTIMRLTAEHGSVSEKDLTQHGFHDTEISILRDRALDEIQRLIEKAPFTIS